MDAQTLADVMGHSLPMSRYNELCPAFNSALVQAGCTTVERVAMFCAQIGHESGGLQWMEELADGWAYEGRADLGNVYPGDGPKFKGHGPIQITGRWNHGQVSQWAAENGYVNSPTYFVDHPEELAGDEYGFLGAVWYWTVARNMNSYADNRDILGATKAVNGGTNGLDDRSDRWYRALDFGDALLPTGGEVMSEAVEQGAAQLNTRYHNVRKPVNNGPFLPASFTDEDGPWPNDMWAATVNEVVWDGFTESNELPDADPKAPR
ncbi:MAG: hypothetical protein LC723_06980, partial [Actinobacteria bacterium]|nr:hypothetical protein [Actinomycetota bacterium]